MSLKLWRFQLSRTSFTRACLLGLKVLDLHGGDNPNTCSCRPVLISLVGYAFWTVANMTQCIVYVTMNCDNHYYMQQCIVNSRKYSTMHWSCRQVNALWTLTRVSQCIVDTFASVNNALLQMHCWLNSTHAQLGPEPRHNDLSFNIWPVQWGQIIFL